MNRKVQYQESLSSWLSDAAAYGDTPAEQNYYIHNARQQITQWGGNKLKDYASKAWQGMYAGYYLPRWQQYLAALRQAKVTKQAFDNAKAQQNIIDWESARIADSSIPAHHTPTDVVAASKQLMALIKQPL